MTRKSLFIIMILILSVTTKIYAEISPQNSIAVVKSRYDNIELVLSNYRIPYTLIEYNDLEKEDTFTSYNAIFLPSGLSSYYESNIAVNSKGKEIRSVNIAEDFFELDTKKFSRLFRSFTKNGGASYFSGYSYKLLSEAYDIFEFFYDFPYMGEPGRIEATAENDLARFILSNKAALYMGYTGWITIKEAKDSELLSESVFQTPRGEKTGPVSILHRDGKGEILYTSYYSTVYSEFKRFNIYRVAGNSLKNELLFLVSKNFQKVTGIILDAFLGDEASRLYLIKLYRGNNTLYFLSGNTPFMFEIYNPDMELTVSVDRRDLSQTYNIMSKDDDYCFIRIYPSTSSRFDIFAIISAKGAIFSKGVKITLALFVSIIVLIFTAAFIKVLLSRLK
jgi:hypothetical protein